MLVPLENYFRKDDLYLEFAKIPAGNGPNMAKPVSEKGILLSTALAIGTLGFYH